MFGLRNKSSEPASDASLGALDRIGRRSAEVLSDAPQPTAIANDRASRLTAAAATLERTVAPRLRDMVAAGTAAGDITRQAGLLAQVHFRSHGVMLAPLELRGYVAEVLRPVLPATSFKAPEISPPLSENQAPAATPEDEAAEAPAPSEKR